jgi:hypothetical protein
LDPEVADRLRRFVAQELERGTSPERLAENIRDVVVGSSNAISYAHSELRKYLIVDAQGRLSLTRDRTFRSDWSPLASHFRSRLRVFEEGRGHPESTRRELSVHGALGIKLGLGFHLIERVRSDGVATTHLRVALSPGWSAGVGAWLRFGKEVVLPKPVPERFVGSFVTRRQAQARWFRPVNGFILVIGGETFENVPGHIALLLTDEERDLAFPVHYGAGVLMSLDGREGSFGLGVPIFRHDGPLLARAKRGLTLVERAQALLAEGKEGNAAELAQRAARLVDLPEPGWLTLAAKESGRGE